MAVYAAARIFCALALGAHAAHIGRPFLYGLGAMGETGVRRCLEIIHRELDITMALCGQTDIAQVDTAILAAADLPAGFPHTSLTD